MSFLAGLFMGMVCLFLWLRWQGWLRTEAERCRAWGVNPHDQMGYDEMHDDREEG
jgi:hypothetical protein